MRRLSSSAAMESALRESDAELQRRTEIGQDVAPLRLAWMPAMRDAEPQPQPSAEQATRTVAAVSAQLLASRRARVEAATAAAQRVAQASYAREKCAPSVHLACASKHNPLTPLHLPVQPFQPFGHGCCCCCCEQRAEPVRGCAERAAPTSAAAAVAPHRRQPTCRTPQHQQRQPSHAHGRRCVAGPARAAGLASVDSRRASVCCRSRRLGAVWRAG